MPSREQRMEEMLRESESICDRFAQNCYDEHAQDDAEEIVPRIRALLDEPHGEPEYVWRVTWCIGAGQPRDSIGHDSEDEARKMAVLLHRYSPRVERAPSAIHMTRTAIGPWEAVSE